MAEIKNETEEKNEKKNGAPSTLQHNENDLDWAYRPYLFTNTRTDYDSSPMEGDLPQ